MSSRLHNIVLHIMTVSVLQIGHLVSSNPPQCPFLDATTRSNSVWSSFMQLAVFLPDEEAEAVQSLSVQASELSEIFNHFKEQYVLSVFHELNFTSHSERYSHMAFPWLIPPKMKRLIAQPHHAWTALTRSHLGDKGVLISAYNLFQRVAIGLELVKRDLETSTSEEYVTKKGSYWKLAFEAANRVVEAVFLGLKSRGHNAENLAVLKRDIVLPAAACATSEAMRDLRDWVILSNSIQIVQAYKQLFGMYARNRHLAN